MTPRRASAAGCQPFEIGDTNDVAGSLVRYDRARLR